MKGLLNKLNQEGVVHSQWVYNTMLQVDRADFIETNPYFDDSQYLGYNVVISAPHMHAYALEYLSPALNNFQNLNKLAFADENGDPVTSGEAKINVGANNEENIDNGKEMMSGGKPEGGMPGGMGQGGFGGGHGGMGGFGNQGTVFQGL